MTIEDAIEISVLISGFIHVPSAQNIIGRYKNISISIAGKEYFTAEIFQGCGITEDISLKFFDLDYANRYAHMKSFLNLISCH